MKLLLSFLPALLPVLIPFPGNATTIAFATPGGATESGGSPVSAQVTFTTGTNSLTITLTNQQPNPLTVAQNLSDLFFVISPTLTTGTLVSSSGLERTVNGGGGTYSDGSLVSTGWGLNSNVSLGGNTGLELFDLGAAGPAHTIIGTPDGSNLYSNANASIAGNGPHNPFLAGVVTYVLTVPGLTGGSTISNVPFSFGTTDGDNVDGLLTSTTNTTPEPATWLLLAGGGGMILLLAGKYRPKH